MTLAKSPLIIGHRGASAVAPENTLVAFEEALRVGADGIEFDVRLSRDEVPVVIHDGNLKRTALVNGLVSELTVDQLREFNVGAFSRRLDDERYRVPTLVEVLQMFKKTDGLLYLEMKGEPVGEKLVERVAELIDEHAMGNQVIVECFQLEAIKLLKDIAPGIRTAALFESRLRRPFSRNPLKAATESHVDEVAPHHSLVTESLVKEAKDSGFEVVVWTVDDPRWIQRAKNLGIKALITNDPASMLVRRDS